MTCTSANEKTGAFAPVFLFIQPINRSVAGLVGKPQTVAGLIGKLVLVDPRKAQALQ